MVYDFKDEDSFPESRLSVFLQVEGNVRHGESILLASDESSLEWRCSGKDLVKIERGGNCWAGSCNFYPVKGECFPEGKYTVIYEDKAERESEMEFSLSYPEKISACKVADIPDAIEIPYKKKIAVYSNKDELLFLGDKPLHWEDNEDVLMDYNNAWFTRVCYTFSKNTVYCLMPPVELGNKDFEKENISEEN